MIDPKVAVQSVAKSYPDRLASEIFDYDSTRYIVAASLKNVKKDYNGCFFSVNKSSGKIAPFAPGEDYDKFFDAIDNKQIKV